MIQDFFPGEEEGGLRIDKYLSQAAEGLSRSYIQKLLKEGRVLAEGRPVWGADCAMCLACYHHCPEHAVGYGNATKGKGQYAPGMFMPGKKA